MILEQWSKYFVRRQTSSNEDSQYYTPNWFDST